MSGTYDMPEGHPELDPDRCGRDAQMCGICARPQCPYRVAAAPKPPSPPTEADVDTLREQLRVIEARRKGASTPARIAVFKDGNLWCALVGPNLQAGVAEFGSTPTRALGHLLRKHPEAKG